MHGSAPCLLDVPFRDDQRPFVITGMGWSCRLGRMSTGCGRDGQPKTAPWRRDRGDVQEAGGLIWRRFGTECENHADAGLSTKRLKETAGLAPHAAPGVKKRRLGIYLGAGEGQPDFDNYATLVAAVVGAELSLARAPIDAQSPLLGCPDAAASPDCFQA